jgi:hypothetical protein
MAWAWRYEGANGQSQAGHDAASTGTGIASSTGSGVPAGNNETFPSQSDAESWLGQSWRELVAAGVVTAILVEDDRVEYRMSLLPAGE